VPLDCLVVGAGEDDPESVVSFNSINRSVLISFSGTGDTYF
jgi:hypothetical protein